MVLGKSELANMLLTAANRLEENVDVFSAIDSKFGDGDHGVTIKKIARRIKDRVYNWQDESIKAFFYDLGEKVMEVNGGSAGSLYGTMISGFSRELSDNENELDADAIKRMFLGCLEQMRHITEAKVGDKTMMDALIPSVIAVQNCEEELPSILRVAARAAKDGMSASKSFVSKYGRAKNYKEATIGTPDVGAVSTSIFIEALADGCNIQASSG